MTRVSRCVGAAAALVLALTLLAPAAALAHVPFLESPQRSDAIGSAAVPYPEAQALPSPTISRAIYGYLAPGARFDAYVFTVNEPVTTEVGLIVPKRLGLETFRPSLLVFAEGSNKALVASDPGSNPRTSFYEPFSFASFWSGPTVTATFKPGERYYAVISPGDGGKTSGAYVLTFAGAERFSVADWGSSLAAMPVIWLGSWGGGPARPGAYACSVLLVVLLGLAIWLWVRRRLRRRSAAEAPPSLTDDPAGGMPVAG